MFLSHPYYLYVFLFIHGIHLFSALRKNCAIASGLLSVRLNVVLLTNCLSEGEAPKEEMEENHWEKFDRGRV